MLSKILYRGGAFFCPDGFWLAKHADVLQVAIAPVDGHTEPGSIKVFVDGSTNAFVLMDKLVGVSIGKHAGKELFLVSHWNCAAYGGNAAFSSPQQQFQTYRDHLEIARDRIKSLLPEHIQALLPSVRGPERENLERAMNSVLKIHGLILHPRELTHDFVHPEDCVPSIVF